MIVDWAGTSLSTGRFGTSQKTSEADFLTYFSELRTQGKGYVEVQSSSADYPWLALSFSGDRAVVHKAIGEQSFALLVGDGSVPADEPVQVPVFDELSEFTGEFVSSLDRAWGVIWEFARTGASEGFGQWWDL